MSQQNNIEVIEQYLSNELTESERQALENQLQGDENLNAEYQRRHTAHQMIDFMIGENLRNQLRDLEAEDTQVISLASRSRRMYALAIAASVAILIGAFFFLFPAGHPASNQQIVMDYYETPPFTLRGADQSIAAQIARGIQALNNKDYPAAIETLQQIPADDPYYMMSRYYLGHAHFLSEQFQEAQLNFAEVMTSNDVRFIEDAQWYQMLSCYALDGECQPLLDQIIAKQNHLHHAKALEIQQSIAK